MAQEITALRVLSPPVADAGYRGFAHSSATPAPRATLPKAPSALAQPAAEVVAAAAAAPEADEATAPTREAVAEALDELSRQFKSSRTNLQFRIDDELGRMIVSIVDADDGTVLRQLPSEVALRIARGIEDFKTQLKEVA